MSWIDAHTMLLHDELNFVDDCPSSGFDTQDSGRLDDVVRSGVLADDAYFRRDG